MEAITDLKTFNMRGFQLEISLVENVWCFIKTLLSRISDVAGNNNNHNLNKSSI